MNCEDISHGELDLIILGQLQDFGNNSDSVSVDPATRPLLVYVRTLPITIKEQCLQTFLFLHSIGSKCLNNILKKFLNREYCHVYTLT